MPTWHDDKLLELASQLTYSPAEKRREQMQFAIALLPAIDPAKTYPWDFVHFRVTGFQPRSHNDHTLAGKVLRADLATLIEFLSDTLAIAVEQGAQPGDAVLLLDDVARKFSVSDKTIQRWRKQGLIALRYVYPDGRRRLGFLESAVAQFAADNKDRVDRSANFRQISEEERRKIIELARFLATQHRLCIKEVSRHIAHQLKRSPEAIRYTIRNYDLEHPEAAVFSDAPEGAIARRPAAATLPLFTEGPAAAGELPAVVSPRVRAGQLKGQAIEFISNPLFEHPDAENIILRVLPGEALSRAQAAAVAAAAGAANGKAGDDYLARVPRDLPAFLQDIFRQPVMPQELEIDAFRRMNYLLYRAARLQAELNPEAATEKELAEIESLLSQAAETKNLIVQSNLRVAVHVARKHQRPDRPLMELVSDATIWLMRAADRFDYARSGSAAGGTGHGARFSTYASFAVMKNFARDRVEQLTRRDSHVLTGQQEILNTLGAREMDGAGDRLDAATLRNDLLSVFQELPERERELLTHHYGLDQSAPALSLAQIGDKMGITKARVVQLEARALRKLRHLLETRREKLHKASAK